MQCNKLNNCNVILGIETSCDETGVALYDTKNIRLLDHLVYSQIDLHAQYGGVVPELASRNHLEKLPVLVEALICRNKLYYSDVKAISYTAGPGLMGALMVGASFAKALAFALNVPLVPVNHLEAHLLTPFIETGLPIFPFLGLLVSGGNTLLVLASDIGKYQILGETLDDAVGEVFDKVAKKLGFPYPGGAKLASLADQVSDSDIIFPIPMQKHPGLDFSFSGLKTYAINHIKCLEKNNYAKLAYAFQEAITKALLIKVKKAIKQNQINNFILAGGVSANKKIRQTFLHLGLEKNINTFIPPIKWSGDNGAMIAFVGSLYLERYGGIDSDKILANPRLTLENANNELWKEYGIN